MKTTLAKNENGKSWTTMEQVRQWCTVYQDLENLQADNKTVFKADWDGRGDDFSWES